VLDLKITVGYDPDQHKTMSPEGVRRLLRKAMKRATVHWHKNYAPFHFRRDAYKRYPGVHAKKKKHGAPLVQSGTARDRILAPRTEKDVRAKRGHRIEVRLKLRWGRPPKYSERWIKRWIVGQMHHAYGIDYKKSRAVVEAYFRGERNNSAWNQLVGRLLSAVYRKAGYSKKVKKQFNDSLSTVNRRERKILMAGVAREFTSMLKPRKRRRKRIV